MFCLVGFVGLGNFCEGGWSGSLLGMVIIVGSGIWSG